ncbi:hypothetical protein HHK36_014939 [Tetracentron sinense]|uniref:Uncharacterized protein n=1 Tax=Tetracentron sinense TaxID=13715 RepID=A0A835DD62_TETSI|nr:hypothetical protein HHK36_014939 [Tetracentron sinense]
MNQGGMDRGGFDSRKRTGSVKAAVNMYGEQIHGGKPELKKTQMEFSEPSSRTRELHLAKRDIGRFNENRKYAESEKAQAELELFNAKKLVKELTSRIEDSNSKAKARNRDLEVPKKPERHEDGWASTVGKNEKYQYAKVMRELEFVKQELSKLKLDMASVLEAKTRADKET